jgi:hypothetical protein
MAIFQNGVYACVWRSMGYFPLLSLEKGEADDHNPRAIPFTETPYN